MKKVFLGCFVAACMFGAAGPVMAADSNDWTGFYLGLTGGWGWSNLRTTISPMGTVSQQDFLTTTLSGNIDGAMFGPQVGYNFDLKNRLVLGIEGDFNGASLNGTKQTAALSRRSPMNATDSFKVTNDIEWLTTIRPRVGAQVGAGLAYVTGGVAWAKIHHTSQVNAETATSTYGANASTDDSNIRTGWAVGAGYEWMVAKNWSVRGEYMHYGFTGTNNNFAIFDHCQVPGQCNMNVSTGSSNIDAVRVGVNYRFGASAGSAMAADSNDWTGFYLGLTGGWGWSNLRTTISPMGTRSQQDFLTTTPSGNIDGAMFGPQVGYNFDLKNRLVLGIEGDFNGTSLNGTKQTATPGRLFPTNTTDSFKVTNDIEWLTTIRPRVGAQVGAGLAYVTGGVAWAKIHRTSQVNAEVAPSTYGANASTDDSNIRTGWAVGAGYEWMVAKNWSVRGEYMHYGLNGTDNDFAIFDRCAVPGQCNMNVSTGSSNIDALRVGVNYRF